MASVGQVRLGEVGLRQVRYAVGWCCWGRWLRLGSVGRRLVWGRLVRLGEVMLGSRSVKVWLGRWVGLWRVGLASLG